MKEVCMKSYQENLFNADAKYVSKQKYALCVSENLEKNWPKILNVEIFTQKYLKEVPKYVNL